MSNIYFWGKPIIKQLQNNENTSNINCIETNQAVQQVKCGAEHAFLLTKNNQLYAMGSNLHGQCGAGYLKEIPIYQILIPTKSKIVSISCGRQHTLILDQLGCLFTSGSGIQGATGQGSKQNSYTFKQIMIGIRKISAGMDHSLVIKANKVFGWGNNEQGQLGLHSKKNYFTPQQLNIYPCDQLCAGPKYSIFVTVKGVYGCGINNNYQLGLGSQKDVHYPKALNIDEQLEQVYCGNYCLGKTKNNLWYIWGSGAFGVFKFPTKASFFQGCQKVSMGISFGMMLKNDKIYVWGSNNYGQLGSDYDEDMNDYAHESYNLTELQLSEFCCGVNFGIGISQSLQRLNRKNGNQIRSEINYGNQKIGNYNKNKMRTVYTDYLQRNKPINTYKTHYEGGKRYYDNNFTTSQMNYSNIDEEERQYHDKALSDQVAKKRTTPTNNQSLSLHQYASKNYNNMPKHQQSPIYIQQYHQIPQQLRKKTSKQKIINLNLKRQTKSLKYHDEKLQNKMQIKQSQLDPYYDFQDNKQNWSNIEKLRKAIDNQHRQQRNSFNNNNFEGLQMNTDSVRSDQNQKCRIYLQSYGQNLQRLKVILQEARVEKQLSSENEQQK